MENWQKIDIQQEVKRDQRLALDIWIIKTFHILPTDERFRKLTEYEKEFLFEAYFEIPENEVIYRNKVISRKQAEIDNDNFIKAFAKRHNMNWDSLAKTIKQVIIDNG